MLTLWQMKEGNTKGNLKLIPMNTIKIAFEYSVLASYTTPYFQHRDWSESNTVFEERKTYHWGLHSGKYEKTKGEDISNPLNVTKITLIHTGLPQFHKGLTPNHT